ncbi:MAG: hypothetical protein GY762_14465 [Proteobacteria bacterium]|nr:hypothetical protein [Pseudomonadota bacterium]
MDRHHLKKIDFFIAAFGAVATCLSVFFLDLSIFLGAALGSLMAFFNWVSFRYLVHRLTTSKKRGRIALILGGKTLAVLGLVAVIVLFLPVHALAFIIGLSTLFLGIITLSFIHTDGPNEVALEEDL